MSTAAKGYGSTATQPEDLAFLIHDLEIPFDAKRPIVENGDFCTRHLFLHRMMRTKKLYQDNHRHGE